MFFMKQFSKYLIGVSDVYAYCLMQNHFHFVIKIKTNDKSSVEIKDSNKDGLHSFDNLVSKQIGKFIR
jgi:putative transposase